MIQHIQSYIVLTFIFVFTVHASEVELTKFEDIPLDIRIKIFTESEPTKALSISRDLRRGMNNAHIWAKSREDLTNFVQESLDEEGAVIEDSRLMQALRSPTDSILIRRLIFHSASSEDETLKKQIRQILTARIAPNPFRYTDKMIEFGRQAQAWQDSILHLARADLTHGCPLIHSELLPAEYKPYFSSAILELTQSQSDGTYRVWRFTKHPNQAMLATVSNRHGEEFPLFNGFLVNGHLQLEDKQILYRDKQRRMWPILG